jgi:hypothetical protein
MMEWMSRILLEKWLVLMRILGWELGINVADFCSHHITCPSTQYDTHGPDDPFRTINYHHLDVSGHDGLDEQDIGWRNGWC